MANQKITELTALTTPALADLLAIVDDPAGTPETKKITLANLISSLFLSNVVVQVLTSSSGTYTPTSGMKKVLGIAVGGGAGGQSVTAIDDAAGGGGGGGTVIRLMTAAEIGTSKPYAVGASVSAATNGNATTLDTAGALMSAGGGITGSATGNTTTVGVQAAGGAGGTAANGNLNIPGQPGGRGVIYSTSHGTGGFGGDTVFGRGGAMSGSGAAGNNGTAYGGGGGGAHTLDDTNRSGGTGAAGVIYLIEWIS